GHSQKTKSAAVSPTSAHIEAKLLASMSVLDVATSAKFFKVSSVISTRIDSAATFSNGDLPIHVASNAAPSPPSTRSRVATPSDFVWPAQLTIPLVTSPASSSSTQRSSACEQFWLAQEFGTTPASL